MQSVRRFVVALALLLCGTADAAPRLVAVSNRADLISGGDVLVQLKRARLARTTVRAAGHDVTSAFSRRADGRVLGLVTGLPLGRSGIVARVRHRRGARLTVTNHPRTGPVFSGAQVQPWLCPDAGCEVEPTVSYKYHPAVPGLLPFVDYDPEDPPNDVAMTTTSEGRQVPFIVRVETGALDRGTYSIAVLAAPGETHWNGKLLLPFGGDCKPWHQQDTPVDPLGNYAGPIGGNDPLPGLGLADALGSIFGNGNALTALGRGFAVANSSNMKLGSQCNPVVSAEATMMLKEHIAEAYGPIRYTIGAGSSGGSMQQHYIAAAYPGLLDGIQPMASFPDIWGPVQEATDCHLLNRYFDSAPAQGWTQDRRDAVGGALVGAGCLAQW
ncbi:MAG: hypothetical protein QOF76_79, partial [Solirubrobacteraceae bacterium]|nr:hypothetical protein [Solirubrobacteraceae bacterium]